MDTIHIERFLFASREHFGLASRLTKRRLLALLGAAPFSLPALAQSKRGTGKHGGDDASKAGGHHEPTPTLEITLHELGEDLKLTAQQQPLFDSYADKVRAFATDVTRDRQRQKSFAHADVIVRIDNGVNQMRNRLTAMEDIADAAKVLYAKLDGGQRLAADPRLATIMLMPLGGTGPAKSD